MFHVFAQPPAPVFLPSLQVLAPPHNVCRGMLVSFPAGSPGAHLHHTCLLDAEQISSLEPANILSFLYLRRQTKRRYFLVMFVHFLAPIRNRQDVWKEETNYKEMIGQVGTRSEFFNQYQSFNRYFHRAAQTKPNMSDPTEDNKPAHQ